MTARKKIRAEVVTGDGLFDRRVIELIGRDAQTLEKLVEASSEGITSLTDGVGVRLSGYIHKLRHKYGVEIKTLDEAHGREFAGTHARYVLRSRVNICGGACGL